MSARTKNGTTWLLLFLVLVWGINWPLSKLALSYAPPLLFSGMRTFLGGLLLLIVAIPRIDKLQWRKTWRMYLISSLFNIILFYGLQTVGLTYLPSGLFSAIVFLQPVLFGVFAWFWLHEPMHSFKLFGLLLGFAGVAVISTGGLAAHISVIGILLALGCSVSWAIGTVYVKKIGSSVDSIWLVSVQLLTGGLFMTAVGSGTESWSSIVWSSTFIFCLIFIATIVIAIGWLVYFTLLGSGDASKVASFTFLIPVVAILVGMLFLHEPFSMSLLAGLLLIVLSIVFVNRKKGMIRKVANVTT